MTKVYSKAEASQIIFDVLRMGLVCSATYDGTTSYKENFKIHGATSQHAKRIGKRCAVGHLIDPARAEEIQTGVTAYSGYPMAAQLVRLGDVIITDLEDRGASWLSRIQQAVDGGDVSSILKLVGQEDYDFGDNKPEIL